MPKPSSITLASILFGLFSWLLSLWAQGQPEIVEHLYSRGLYQGIRCMIDHSFGFLPFPNFYVFWVLVIGYWVFQIRKRPPLHGYFNKMGFWAFKIIGFAAMLMGLFFWMWGYNYSRVPIPKQLGIDQAVPMDTAALWQDLRAETAAMDSLRLLLVGRDTNAINSTQLWPVHAEDTVRAAVVVWLSRHGYPAMGRVRGRSLYPAGLLFAFNASGLYWPFVGEANIEAGLHPLEKLPTLAHEMAHGYGFGNEGICNFVAYAACYRHPNRYIAYTNRLIYWYKLADNCLESDPARYDSTYRPYIPAGIRQDVHAIAAQHQQYQFEFLSPAISAAVYGTYLQTQGVREGMASYDQVVLWVHAMREKELVSTK